MPAPVFIAGHWRSGTTHLYNVTPSFYHGIYFPKRLEAQFERGVLARFGYSPAGRMPRRGPVS